MIRVIDVDYIKDYLLKKSQRLLPLGFLLAGHLMRRLLLDLEGDGVGRGTAGKVVEELTQGGAAVSNPARGLATAYEDAAARVGGDIARVDADALEAGHAAQQGKRAVEARGVSELHGVTACGDGRAAKHLLTGLHGLRREVTVSRLQGVAEGLPVDGEGSHGVEEPPLGTLQCEMHE